MAHLFNSRAYRGFHMGRRVSVSRRTGIALLFPAALLAACGGSSTGGGSSTPTPSAASGPAMQPTIAAEVPAAVKAAAPLQIATDASYAPNEFVDLNGNLVGWDIDLAKDVCKVLGIACTINNVTFSDIIPALLENPSKYQMSFSSYTPTTAREAKGIDFITYYQAGEAWLVKTGGATISTGLRHVRSHGCRRVGHHRGAGRLGLHGHAARRNQDQAAIPTTARAPASRTSRSPASTPRQRRTRRCSPDEPISAGRISRSPTTRSSSRPASSRSVVSACSVYPYGVAIVKTLGLDQAVEDAIKYLIDNNFYTQILKTWNVQDGAIASSAVGVNDNNPVGSTCVPAY